MFVIRCGFLHRNTNLFLLRQFSFVPLPIADRSDTFEAHALVFRRAAAQSAAWSRALLTKNHRTDDCGFDGQRAEVMGWGGEVGAASKHNVKLRRCWANKQNQRWHAGSWTCEPRGPDHNKTVQKNRHSASEMVEKPKMEARAEVSG